MARVSVFVAFLLLPATQSFTGKPRRSAFSHSIIRLYDDSINTIRGDPVRDSAGIRPSLHPLTINTIAEILKVRAKKDEPIPLRVSAATSSSSSVQPVQVAVAAAKIAADAIQKRQHASGKDGMLLTVPEQQTVVGRVVGVVMRLPDLEAALRTKCQAASWIAKYGEWDSFGVLSDETTSSAISVDERIVDNPLFCMNRAECLLALFLDQVEAPELARKNVTVPDNSRVDFIDADRRDVLLGEL